MAANDTDGYKVALVIMIWIFALATMVLVADLSGGLKRGEIKVQCK